MRNLALAAVLLFTLMPAVVTFAQVQENAPLGSISNPADLGSRSTVITTDIDPDSFAQLIIDLINWFSWFIGAVAVVVGLYAGFLFITGGGDPTRLATARRVLFWAVVGIAVAILAFGIIAITKAIIKIT